MQKKPFCYTLVRCGPGNQDLLFKRIREDTQKYAPNVWAMHMDISDPQPETVLVFVQGTTKREEIMAKINRVQTYFREQTEPLF